MATFRSLPIGTWFFFSYDPEKQFKKIKARSYTDGMRNYTIVNAAVSVEVLAILED